MAPRNLRKKKADSDSDEDDPQTLQERIDDARTLIKSRAKAKGVGADALALGDDAPDAAAREKDAAPSKDEAPKAGLRVMNAMAGAFAGESSAARDPDAEDPHMLQYVEAELAKRRQASGVSDVSTTGDDANQKSRAPPAAASLWETPAALASAPRETEDSADRYLTGIVEVQLPAEVKFRNIEETERAKAELLKKQRRRDHRGGAGGAGGGGGIAAGGNFSSNFALHKKQHAAAQKHGARGGKGSTAMQPPPPHARGEARPQKRDRAENVASDDYVFKRWMNNEKKRKH